MIRSERTGVLDDGSPVDYAWGTRVTTQGHTRTITHGGSWPGWVATTVRCPERRIAVALLTCDGDHAQVHRFGRTLALRLHRMGTS